jgi:DNA-binding NarL/FixJ family response regulator
MQYRGLRRTFSLAARSREGAAAEAKEISERLHRQGWEGMAQPLASHREQAVQRTELGYWKQRLLLRPGRYPGLAGDRPGFATRIDHAGIRCFFPLPESEAEPAARRALTIYEFVVERGWAAARRQFPREVCIAIHWSYDPLLWTYTTIHTLPPEPATDRTGLAPGERAVLLIEPDPALRRALARCIDQNPGCRCIPCHPEQAKSWIGDGTPFALCLVNAHHQQPSPLVGQGQFPALPGGLPSFSYSVHADSDEVFLAPPGGISGYLLTRQPPRLLLAPVLPALDAGLRSPEDLGRATQLFAQRVLQRARLGPAANASARLTHRELEVLGLLSRGHVDKKIAGTLGISAWTVHDHVKRIFEKLGVHSRLEAVLAYLQK